MVQVGMAGKNIGLSQVHSPFSCFDMETAAFISGRKKAAKKITERSDIALNLKNMSGIINNLYGKSHTGMKNF